MREFKKTMRMKKNKMSYKATVINEYDITIKRENRSDRRITQRILK